METKKRIGYEGAYVAIVPDNAAGARGRYTVYKIPAAPSRPVEIVGRELPLNEARKLAKRLGL